MPINGKEQTHWFSFNFYDKIIPKKNNYQIKRSTLTGKSFIGPTKEQKQSALMIAYEARQATIYEGPEPTAVKTKLRELVGSSAVKYITQARGILIIFQRRYWTAFSYPARYKTTATLMSLLSSEGK